MRRSLALALCLLTAGCLSEPTLPPASAIVGTWALEAVNDSPLPFTYPTGKVIVSETLTMGPDGSFGSTDTYSDGTLVSAAGAYTLIGAEVDFTDFTHGIVFPGDWNASSITQHFGSYHLRFRKVP